MSKVKLSALALLSGVLLSLAWWDMLLAPLMLLAFVPLLWVEDFICKHEKEKIFSSWAVFGYSFLPFLLWNLTTVYWVAYSTSLAIALPFAQAALMALVFQTAHYCRKHFAHGRRSGLAFFAIFFLAFEFLHLHWDINFPWLNLGNSFAKFPYLIQWYEYTGVGGGSLWIWLCNISFFCLLQCFLVSTERKAERISRKAVLIFSFAVLILPIAVSLIRWFTYSPRTSGKTDVVVVQPNLDPYGEQYDYSPRQVCDIVIDLAAEKADENTDFILCPESCLQDYAWEENLDASPSIVYLRNFENKYPKAEIISGMSSRRMLPKGVMTKAARKHRHIPNRYYESCNIAVKIDRDTVSPCSQLRHKSILTPFVEKMPFKAVLGFLGDLALDLGGTVGTLGTDEEYIVFSSDGKPKTATAICYESTDGRYISQFVGRGAELIFIITNDGWWKNSPGHRQHAAFASLRAIENRRPIARSANTGISCFVSPKGESMQQTEYWKEAVIKQTLYPQKEITFYTKYGDYIYRAACFMAILFLLLSFVVSHLRKAEEKKHQNKKL